MIGSGQPGGDTRKRNVSRSGGRKRRQLGRFFGQTRAGASAGRPRRRSVRLAAWLHPVRPSRRRTLLLPARVGLGSPARSLGDLAGLGATRTPLLLHRAAAQGAIPADAHGLARRTSLTSSCAPRARRRADDLLGYSHGGMVAAAMRPPVPPRAEARLRLVALAVTDEMTAEAGATPPRRVVSPGTGGDGGACARRRPTTSRSTRADVE